MLLQEFEQRCVLPKQTGSKFVIRHLEYNVVTGRLRSEQG